MGRMRGFRVRARLVAGLGLAATMGVAGSVAQRGATATAATKAPNASGARLQLVAQFPHQVTGVTVARDGRIFVNFPRWAEDAPVSVAELGRDGQLTPYPNAEWNAWRNTKQDILSAADHFVCVQSVVADDHGHLWALDPAAPAQEREALGGPKLVEINLGTNMVMRTILFDRAAAPQGSYLNDVRFSPDGRHAYITDSGARGALVVVDLRSGAARRVLDGDPRTQREPGVVVTADGQELRRPDGRGVQFSADGIALSPDGRALYWQALSGTTLYSLPTAALDDPTLASGALAARVTRVGANGVADGLLISKVSNPGRMYVTQPELDAVKVREGARLSILVQDKRLRWPDTFAEGPDGAIYVTTSHIQDMSWFKPQNPPQLTTQLWRIAAG